MAFEIPLCAARAPLPWWHASMRRRHTTTRCRSRPTAAETIAPSAPAGLRWAPGTSSTPSGHSKDGRRGGRSSQPMAGLLLQRARRRGVDGHHNPRPQIRGPRLLQRRAHPRRSSLRGRAAATRRASSRRLTSSTSRPPPLAATGSSELTCRTATGITEPPVRCVVYIHPFPTTSRTQEGRFSAERDRSSCSGR